MVEFIPKPYKKEPVTVRIDHGKLKVLDAVAKKADLSRSALINQCIDYALKNLSTFKNDI